ncbi:MAG: phosphoglucosamine mutase [archaeon]
MFGTSGIRGEFGVDVTTDLALSVGRALAAEGAERIVVGRDPRTTGQLLADAVSAGAREGGSDVTRLGVAATPSIARGVGWYEADAGVAVTASHNPPKDNGIKLWNPSGQAFDERQRAAITERIQTDAPARRSWRDVGTETTVGDVNDRHASVLSEQGQDLDGLEVVVDVGNGAGAVTAEALRRRGASVRTLDAQQDGHFPGREIEPTEEALPDLQHVVAACDADLGVAHDGDADRMVAITGTGEYVPGDVLLALFARAEASEGDRVAAPINTSMLVDDVLESVGASVVRTRVGDVYVAEAATAHDVVFGGEPSGAWIWPAETLCPDGPMAAVRLAASVARNGPLSDTVAAVGAYPTYRDAVPVDDREVTMNRVERVLRERFEPVDDTDGIRVATDDGWFLVRASGTQPLVRVTAEAETETRAEKLFEEARSIVDESV